MRFRQRAYSQTTRRRIHLCLAIIVSELCVAAWYRDSLMYSSSSSSRSLPSILAIEHLVLSNNNQEQLQRYDLETLDVVLYHNNSVFHSGCCLNNLFKMIMGEVLQGCELAQQYITQNATSTAVLLPQDLDVGGILRTSTKNSSFGMYSTKAIADLQHVARTMYDCHLVTRHEVADLPTVQRIPFDRPYKRSHQMISQGPFLDWIYRSMGFPKSLQPTYDICYGKVTRKQSNYVAAHLRIEQDWHPYCEKRSNRSHVQACQTPRQIAQAMSVFPKRTVVLLYGDVHRRYRELESPKNIWPEINPSQTSYHNAWSSDCKVALRNLTYNEVALMDFWVSLQASVFVGTHFSTFSNMVTFGRQLRRRQTDNTTTTSSSSYVYSCPEIAPLVLRLDGGLVPSELPESEWCQVMVRPPSKKKKSQPRKASVKKSSASTQKQKTALTA
jgi:hypothetical protein